MVYLEVSRGIVSAGPGVEPLLLPVDHPRPGVAEDKARAAQPGAAAVEHRLPLMPGQQAQAGRGQQADRGGAPEVPGDLRGHSGCDGGRVRGGGGGGG